MSYIIWVDDGLSGWAIRKDDIATLPEAIKWALQYNGGEPMKITREIDWQNVTEKSEPPEDS